MSSENKIGKRKTVNLHFAFCAGCDKPMHTAGYILEQGWGDEKRNIPVCGQYLKDNNISKYSGTVTRIIKPEGKV